MESPIVEEYPNISIPRGGPIYVPDLVSSVTGVMDFEDSVIQELQNLRAVTCSEPSQACEEDISVDELRIFSEEELIDKALEEAFKEGNDAGNCPPISEQISNKGMSSDSQLESSKKGPDGPTSEEVLDGPSIATRSSEKQRACISKKRKNKRTMPYNHDNSYVAEVEQLVKIKQKQHEDRAAARLHSFNGSCKINECISSLAEKDEKAKFFKSISSETKVKSSNVRHIPVSYPETVLCVEVYHNKRKWAKTQEFLVLGRQLLTELRDKIYCLTDEIMQKAGLHDPSGYFLIEEVFCNDLRDPAAIDYSRPIFDWLRNSKDEALEKWECIVSGELQKHKKLLGDVGVQKLPRFKSTDMQKTRFCDLRFQLGSGYLYCHQGDCRHIIVIRDMRLLHPEDVSNRAAYPLSTYQQKLRVQKCSVCKIYRATKVTVDDKWAQENPCYFCEKCYFLLHYSADHTLLYSGFSVYDYIHE